MTRLRGWFAGAAVLAGLSGGLALAQTPSQMSEVNGATTGLGTSHRFATVQAAMDHCPGDTIVWGSDKKLVYHVPGSADYGQGQGFYACKMEADDAGFRPAGGHG